MAATNKKLELDDFDDSGYIDTMGSEVASPMSKAMYKNEDIIQVIMYDDFLKCGGGLLKNQKQKRTLKLHANGQVTYWKGSDLRGVIPLESSTLTAVEGNGFYIEFRDAKEKDGRRKVLFEDIKGQKRSVDWV